jgi:hypothetical protein
MLDAKETNCINVLYLIGEDENFSVVRLRDISKSTYKPENI